MLSSVMNTAVSGLLASSSRMGVSANNVANQSTTGDDAYEAQAVAQTAAPQGGVRSQVVAKNPATVPVADGEGGITDAPNVDTAEEVVQQQIASYDFKANLKVLKAADEMAKETINILA